MLCVKVVLKYVLCDWIGGGIVWYVCYLCGCCVMMWCWLICCWLLGVIGIDVFLFGFCCVLCLCDV